MRRRPPPAAPSFALQPWDWSFYAEQVRKAHYDFDQAPWRRTSSSITCLQDGVFYAAHELYGLTFKERRDLPVYHSDVRVFEVFDADGKPLALFLADYFARDNKQGGAWMASYVTQSKLLHQQAVVANHLNIPKPAGRAAGAAHLRGSDRACSTSSAMRCTACSRTCATRCSRARRCRATSSSTPRSTTRCGRASRRWWRTTRATTRAASRCRRELLERVIAAQKFNQGYATTEYLAAAAARSGLAPDHVAEAPAAAGVPAFEAAALQASGLDYAPVPPRYHSTYFSHIFESGYSAGYYAYLWSEVLARDTGQWFHGTAD